MEELQINLGKGQSIDEALLHGAVAGLSAEQISERIGGILSPARVSLHLRELLSGGIRLEDIEHERAILLLLQAKLVELDNTAWGADSLAAAKVMLTYAREIMGQLQKRKALTDEQLNTYDQNVGRQLGHVVDLALTYMKGALRDQVDPLTWDRTKEEALALAWTEIEKRQVEA